MTQLRENNNCGKVFNTNPLKWTVFRQDNWKIEWFMLPANHMHKLIMVPVLCDKVVFSLSTQFHFFLHKHVYCLRVFSELVA